MARFLMLDLDEKLQKDAPINLIPLPVLSGSSMSSKTAKRYLEERWSLDRVFDVLQKLHKDAPIHLMPDPNFRSIRNLHVLQKSRRNQEG